MYKYLTYLPKNFNANQSYALMIYLHSTLERSDNFELLKNTEPVVFFEKKEIDVPAIFIAPLCPKFESWKVEKLNKLLEEIKGLYLIDTNRIYVSGSSMGGIALLKWAYNFPDIFAAMIPVCSGGIKQMAEKISHIPTWFFHGKKDNVISYHKTQELYGAMLQLGADVKFTLYEDEGHKIWPKVYRNQEIYDWMLSKSKTQQ